VGVGRRQAALDKVAALDDRVQAATDPASLPPLDMVLTSIDGEDASMIDAVLPRVKRRGAVVLIGAPKAPLHVPPSWLMRDEIIVRGSLWFEPHDMAAMLQLIASGVMDLSALHAEEYPLADVNEALHAAHARENPLRHVAVLCR
jgi:D-arabinose 1-dehydrogenase-like Zn-dependent alcohol dehydrogenase